MYGSRVILQSVDARKTLVKATSMVITPQPREQSILLFVVYGSRVILQAVDTA